MSATKAEGGWCPQAGWLSPGHPSEQRDLSGPTGCDEIRLVPTVEMFRLT